MISLRSPVSPTFPKPDPKPAPDPEPWPGSDPDVGPPRPGPEPGPDLFPGQPDPEPMPIESLRTGMSAVHELGGKFATGCAHAFDQARPSNGNTRFPRFVNSHERQGSACQCHVLGEIDHVGHTGIGIFAVPKIVHHWRNTSQEPEDCES